MCALRRVANIARDAARRCRSTSPLVPSFMSRDRHEDVVLSDGELSQLVHAVEEVSEHDLAVHKHDFIDSSYESTGTITYIGVATEEDVHMAVFVMPPGSSIPLHDHVNMSVVSRVLWGELEVQSYDLVPSSWSNLNAESVAVKHELAVTKAGGVTALTPTSGNIHSFHATEWTAVFDVLVPPYDTEHGRECRYYSPLDGVDDVWSLMPSGGGEREKRKHVHLKVSFVGCMISRFVQVCDY